MPSWEGVFRADGCKPDSTCWRDHASSESCCLGIQEPFRFPGPLKLLVDAHVKARQSWKPLFLEMEMALPVSFAWNFGCG